jgi:hypothetical protein
MLGGSRAFPHPFWVGAGPAPTHFGWEQVLLPLILGGIRACSHPVLVGAGFAATRCWVGVGLVPTHVLAVTRVYTPLRLHFVRPLPSSLSVTPVGGGGVGLWAPLKPPWGEGQLRVPCWPPGIKCRLLAFRPRAPLVGRDVGRVVHSQPSSVFWAAA